MFKVIDNKKILWILIAFLIGFFLKFIIENIVCNNVCSLVEGEIKFKKKRGYYSTVLNDGKKKDIVYYGTDLEAAQAAVEATQDNRSRIVQMGDAVGAGVGGYQGWNQGAAGLQKLIKVVDNDATVPMVSEENLRTEEQEKKYMLARLDLNHIEAQLGRAEYLDRHRGQAEAGAAEEARKAAADDKPPGRLKKMTGMVKDGATRAVEAVKYKMDGGYDGDLLRGSGGMETEHGGRGDPDWLIESRALYDQIEPMRANETVDVNAKEEIEDLANEIFALDAQAIDDYHYTPGGGPGTGGMLRLGNVKVLNNVTIKIPNDPNNKFYETPGRGWVSSESPTSEVIAKIIDVNARTGKTGGKSAVKIEPGDNHRYDWIYLNRKQHTDYVDWQFLTKDILFILGNCLTLLQQSN